MSHGPVMPGKRVLGAICHGLESLGHYPGVESPRDTLSDGHNVLGPLNKCSGDIFSWGTVNQFYRNECIHILRHIAHSYFKKLCTHKLNMTYAYWRLVGYKQWRGDDFPYTKHGQWITDNITCNPISIEWYSKHDLLTLKTDELIAETSRTMWNVEYMCLSVNRNTSEH